MLILSQLIRLLFGKQKEAMLLMFLFSLPSHYVFSPYVIYSPPFPFSSWFILSQLFHDYQLHFQTGGTGCSGIMRGTVGTAL